MVRRSTIRTSLAAVLAAATCLAVAAGPIAPAADAAKNTGRYKTSSEAKRKKQRQCKAMEVAFDNWLIVADAAAQDGDAAHWNEAVDNAGKTYDNAKAAGCAWAARVAPPQTPPRTGAVTTVSPIVAALPGR